MSILLKFQQLESEDEFKSFSYFKVCLDQTDAWY